MEKVETARDFLVAARNVIADPEEWTQCVMARDADGESVDSYSPDATCWCAMGALERVDYQVAEQSDSLAVGGLWVETQQFLHGVMGDSITEYNDSHSHADVLGAFDQAIASC